MNAGPDQRWARQALLGFVGPEGQARLASSHAAVVGCGALGCAALDHLVRAGVGTVTLIDRDVVELSNLQRQSLYTEADARDGLPKAEAARQRIAAIASDVAVRAHTADLSARTAERLLLGEGAPGVIVDGTDNYETRYLLNDVALKHGIPLAYGGAVGAEGLAMTVLPGQLPRPCLRCLFPEPPAERRTCDTVGVFGPVVGMVASMQAADALRILLGRHDLIAPTLTRFDLERGLVAQTSVAGAHDPECSCCVQRRFDALDGAHASPVALCGRGAFQIEGDGSDVDLAEITARLSRIGDARQTRFLVRATLPGLGRAGPVGLTVFADGRALVQGVESAEAARSVVARCLGR